MTRQGNYRGRIRPDDLLVTHARLLEVLRYDPESGKFFWKVCTSNRVRVGDEAGSPDPRGYIRINIDGESYLAQRLAWFYVTGEWPVADVDHEDEDKSNNRLANLRPASRSQNMANTGLQTNTPHGVKGAYSARGKRRKRFNSKITVDGVSRSLGYYATAAEAGAAYAEEHRKIYGEFSKVGRIAK